MEDLAKEEEVVLVDEDNKVLGYVGKLEAHQKGLLHRAISIIIFNDKGELLLQQRARQKYHWAGFWSNTCCTHPRKQESFRQAAERRLFEELGFRTELHEAFRFIYKATDESSGLTEWEYDVVFVGTYEGLVDFNRAEVHDVKWIAPKALLADMAHRPEAYTFWFKIIMDELKKREII